MPSVHDSKAKSKAKVQVTAARSGARKNGKAGAGAAARANVNAKAKAAAGRLAKSPKGKNGATKQVVGAAKAAKGSGGAAIILRNGKKKASAVTKLSNLPAKPRLALGRVNGKIAGKMGKTGMAEAPAKGKPGAAKVKGNGAAEPRSIILPPDYLPSESEPFMSEMHRIYFRNKLVAWKEEILRQNMETLKGLHDESSQQADPADRATAETDRALELRARDRQRKLMGKIDAALARIEEGTYGYCEETGEPISLKRLEARPIATLSLEAQERRERRERVFRED